jgi:hypothetical protein
MVTELAATRSTANDSATFEIVIAVVLGTLFETVSTFVVGTHSGPNPTRCRSTSPKRASCKSRRPFNLPQAHSSILTEIP